MNKNNESRIRQLLAIFMTDAILNPKINFSPYLSFLTLQPLWKRSIRPLTAPSEDFVPVLRAVGTP
jgi:hypothetical protein